MPAFISENLSTVIIGTVVFGIVAFALVRTVLNIRVGGSCGCCSRTCRGKHKPAGTPSKFQG